MVHRIPPQIIDQVLDLSLSGLSIRAIAQSVGISVGSVHSLLKEFATQDKDHYLLRTLAVNLHKNGLDVLDYAWLIRVNNVLQNAGATREQVEEIASEIPLCCYNSGLDVENLVYQSKMYNDYLETNPADPAQCNVIIELYNKSIQRLEMGTVQVDEKNYEQKLKNVLEFMLTDYKIHELNEGYLSVLTKQETLERIIDVAKNPSNYADLFFGPPEISRSASFQN